MSDSNGGKRYVTNAELKVEIDKLPTRWEVRFLILAAIIGSQVLPISDVAKAMIP